jgi:hypothetical protein
LCEDEYTVDIGEVEGMIVGDMINAGTNKVMQITKTGNTAIIKIALHCEKDEGFLYRKYEEGRCVSSRCQIGNNRYTSTIEEEDERYYKSVHEVCGPNSFKRIVALLAKSEDEDNIILEAYHVGEQIMTEMGGIRLLDGERAELRMVPSRQKSARF